MHYSSENKKFGYVMCDFTWPKKQKTGECVTRE